MIFLPVAEREAREACRQKRTYHWRWIVAALALGVMTMAYFALRRQWNIGQPLFVAVSGTAFVYCLFGGALRTADTLAEEKRENTLGLLFLTDLKTTDILVGKLFASSVNCLFGVVAMIPILAIPMLMGGVDWGQFSKVTLTLFNTLFLSISWGFLVSALLRTATATVAAAMLTSVFWGGIVTFAAIFIHEEIRARSVSWVVFLFSPVNPLVSAFSGPDPLLNFWGSTITNHLLGWANLGLALFFLPRLWQETPKSKRTERLKARLREFRFGTGGEKTKFRRRLLEQNPIAWLANRERISSSGLLALITLILGAALVIGLSMITARTSQVEEMTILFIGATLVVHALVAFRLAAAACYRLAEDRASGALELILATSISIRDVMRGQWKALARQFFGPITILQAAHVFALCMVILMWLRHGFVGNASILAAIRHAATDPFEINGPHGGLAIALMIMSSIAAMLTLNWFAIGWLGMWLGLRFKRPAAALWTTLALVFVPPWGILIASLIIAGESGLFRSIEESYLIRFFLGYGWFLGLANLFLLTRWARRNLYRSFREAASDRFSESARSIPWRAFARVALRGALAAALVWVGYCTVRTVVDRQGLAAWTAAVAKHRDFDLDRAPVTAAPHSENLAKAPSFQKIVDSAHNRGGANQLPGLWNFLPNNPGAPAWSWTMGGRTDFKNLELALVDARVIASTSSTPLASVLEAYAKRYNKTIEELHAEAGARPQVQFALEQTDRPSRWYNPQHGGELRPAFSLLATRATARAATNDAGAIQDITLALRLAEGLREDPRRLMHSCEITLDLIQPVFELIATETLGARDLEALQSAFQKMDFLSSFDLYRQDWIRQTVNSGHGIIRERRRDEGKARFLAPRLPTGMIRREQAAILQFGLTEMRECVDLTNRVINLGAARRLLGNRPRTYADQHGAVDEFLRVLRAAAFAQTAANQAVLACALERRRLALGSYPLRLEELVPEFLARVPHDVADGKPLRYELAANGSFRIWSIALDGVDHRGSPQPTINSYSFWAEQDRGDWVWHSRPGAESRPGGRQH